MRMWEQGDGSSSGGSGSGKTNASSSKSGANSNRGLYLLLATLSFCLLLYKVWGPLLFITFALVICIHSCYSLLVSDSFFAPHTFVLLGHARNLAIELAQTLRLLYRQGLNHTTLLINYLKSQYKERYQRHIELDEESMNEGKRNLYRLSPMSKSLGENASSRSNELSHSFALNGACNIVKTSTPIPRGSNLRQHDMQNGGLNMFAQAKKSSWIPNENKQSFLNMTQNEDIYHTSKHKSWNNSISPNVKDKSEVIKTVQTVAGPLLTSARYNIDPKIYTDINSPGLTSRLIKYAAEANNRLTHQSQYSAGQFPKVNLNASPLPILSPKQIKARMPVTVRVAPPEMTAYSPPDNSCHQEKQKIYSPYQLTESCQNDPSFLRLKKMALKRHASREDTMLEIAKKQKAEQVYGDQLENLEEMMQKRARDESSTSDEDLSIQSINQRPTKRPKASCHDVLNSLSSSANVFTGVKRKAMDSSRCNSPETEKHFKSSSVSPNRSSSFSVLSTKEIAKSRDQLNVRVSIANASGEPYQKKVEPKITETPKPDNHSPEKQHSPNILNVSTPNIQKETNNPANSPKLTDKLFMKPEPQAREKYKSLIDDQGSETFFKTDERDEIKKQDIDNMRENSMRLRLKSMFDAISGKSASIIDSDTVIEAGEITPSTATTFASLNSFTTTTTVNTSPITTTIVPILKNDVDNKSPTTKHVTFNLPQSNSALSSSSSSLSTQSTTESNKQMSESTSFNAPSTGGFSTASSTPSFNFGSNASSTSATVTSSSKPLSQTSTTGFSFSTNSTLASTTPLSSSSTVEIKSLAGDSTSSSMFASKGPTQTITSTSNNATSSGFSFNNATAKTTSAATSVAPSFSFATTSAAPSFSVSSTTSSAPSFSFSSTTSTAGSTFSFNTNSIVTTSSPVLNTQNSLAKSPSSTSIQKTVTSSASNQPSSIFGGSTTNSPFSAAIGNTAPPVTTSTNTTTSSTPMFSFNNSNKPAVGGFSFNTTTAPSNVAANPPTFSFGSNAQSNANPSSSSTTFAMPSASSTASTGSTSVFNSSPSVFNAPVTSSPSLFSGSPAIGFSGMFKSPSTTATATTTTSTTSIFGSSPSSFGTTPATTTATTPSIFGNTMASTSSSKLPSLFGNTATTTAPSSSSPFGAPTTQTQQPQSNIFSGANATTSSSIFGSSSSPSTGLFSGAGSTPNLAPAANPSEGTSIFGQAKPLSFSGATSAFGTNSQSSSFSSPGLSNANSGSTAFQMGSTSNASAAPNFGKPAPAFGGPASSGNSVFGSTTGAFGSPSTAAAPPAFGSSTNQTAFGASAPSGGFSSTGPSGAFGSTGSATGSFGAGTAPPAFGTSPSSSSFGTPAAATTNSPFGAPASTQPLAPFGGTATTSATSGGTFSFGGAQTTQQQQPPNVNFSFGGGSNANSTSGGGMFQFGANNAAKPAGFNFSAPPATPTINFSGSAAPPAFNAPAANMFSIGSGSSSPRSRPSNRQRRQR